MSLCDHVGLAVFPGCTPPPSPNHCCKEAPGLRGVNDQWMLLCDSNVTKVHLLRFLLFSGLQVHHKASE